MKNKYFSLSNNLYNSCLNSLVIYWPSTEPSIKRCTCVNKRKNSGSRWTNDNYITRCSRRFEPVGVSWRQDAEARASGRQKALGPQWPTVEQPKQDEEELLVWSEELSVKITISHTQPASDLSKIKCKRLYFYKEVRSFVHWNSYVMFDYVSPYICICIHIQLYNNLRFLLYV